MGVACSLFLDIPVVRAPPIGLTFFCSFFDALSFFILMLVPLSLSAPEVALNLEDK